ncbi:ATP-dependent DNA ligase [Candidatus Gottesmanbacteria bacterium]|nr:ATP-dependent DNA ligase [Candidatus Gottesmanbacteria bacterium]
MIFKRLSEYLGKLEETTLRNKITQILAELFHESTPDEIGKLCYLLQGRVAPLFTAIEFGMADKMMIKAITYGMGVEDGRVLKVFQEEGDLGKAVEKIKNQKSTTKNTYKKLNINKVYEILYQVATSGGSGSQDKKITLLGNLLHDVDALSARYIVRITLAKLRMGFSDMTILDSLSWMIKGSKQLRPEIERAYNVRPDLGFISETVQKHGIEGLKSTEPKVGIPILMARAERMANSEDIILKIGKCAIEPKYDGFRLQIHYDGKDVKLFSRNLENVTNMYPDIIKGIKKQIHKPAVIEGEAIGINLKTGEYLPFQETVQRKRKYDVELKAKEIPLHLFAFDCLIVGRENLLVKSYVERRNYLEKLIGKGETVYIAQLEVVSNPIRLEELFQDAVTRGIEGVMAKKLEGIYRAGARDFNWIKYKRSYSGKLADTIDAVVMGYDLGQGKRSGFGIGDFLIGVYDEKQDKFGTVTKIGTGLTDEEWREIKIRSDKLKVKTQPKNYEVDKIMSCDIWITPQIVVEIRADEITRSPVHTAGRVMGPSESGNSKEVKVAGFALRFPRLEKFRDDKKPQDATTLSEVEKMYKLQEKK